MNIERTYKDGRPYYCRDCGLGFGEFIACELPDCQLETEATAKKRQQRLRRRKPSAVVPPREAQEPHEQ